MPDKSKLRNDAILGQVSYLNRGLQGNQAKEALVARVQEGSGYSVLKTTLYREQKVKLFRWQAHEVQG